MHDHQILFTVMKNNCIINVHVERSICNMDNLSQGRRIVELEEGSMQFDPASPNKWCFK